jgi:hypothetical protein
MYLIANVSFGLWALLPPGWIFMAAIIALEAIVLSRILYGNWWEEKTAFAALYANFISGAFGFGLSLLANGGWWLVIWMPWVSSNEVDIPDDLLAISIYYIICFVLSVAIEGLFLQYFLKRYFSGLEVWKACLFANTLSYAIGSIFMYSLSFSMKK